MAIQKYQILNEVGIQSFAEQLLGKVNLRVAERIKTTVDATSNDKTVASAKAVYDLVKALQDADAALTGRIDAHDTQIGNNQSAIADINTAQGVQDGKISDLETNLQNLTDTVNALTHLTIETVVGDISTVTDPQTDVMYFQKDNDQDPSWMIYIYRAPAAEGESGSWISVGDTEVDLSNYWTKDDSEAMREALGVHDAEPIADATITTAVDTAFASTAVDLT